MTDEPTDPYGFCETVVRDGDRDAWLASLFAPADLRPCLHALEALRIELGHVRLRVRQPLAGEIRLQWWRDAIFGAARGDVSGNPIAAALLDTIRRRDLPAELFDLLIDAYRDELYEPHPSTITALEARLDAIWGTSFRLAGLTLAGHGGDLLDAARHAGIAFGASQLLQNPDVGASGLGTDGPTPPELRELALRHLGAFEVCRRTLPEAAKPAYLRLALVGPTLRHTGRQKRASGEAPRFLPQWRRQWILWRAARSM